MRAQDIDKQREGDGVPGVAPQPRTPASPLRAPLHSRGHPGPTLRLERNDEQPYEFLVTH